MSNKLTPEDKERITAIENYLAELYKYLPNPHLPAFQPISTEGLRYGFDTNPLGVEPAQTTPDNGEWVSKVGEWIKWYNGELFLINYLLGTNFSVDNQNGISIDADITSCTKPTDKEVETWLTRIAEKKYKKGDKVKLPNGNIVVEITAEFSYDLGRLWSKTVNYSQPEVVVWQSSGWAEITPKEVEQKERWSVEVKPYFNGYCIYIETCDGIILSEEAATKAAQLIRKTLKQL